LVVAVLIVAAALRVVGLTWLPPGLNAEEIADLTITQALQRGEVASFYRVAGDARTDVGREALFPLVQALFGAVGGDGLLNLRLLPALSGVVSVALMFALGRRLYGPLVGLVAACTLAVSLWPVLLSRSAIRESLLLPLALGALWMFARAIHLSHIVQPDPPRTRSYMVLGVLTAALAYTHWTGLLMLPFVVTVIAVFILTRQPISRRVFGAGVFSFVIAMILGIPYLTFTLRAFPLSGFATLWSHRPESVQGALTSSLNTVLAVTMRGDALPQHNLAPEPLLGLMALALFVMGLIVVIDRHRAANALFVLLALAFGLLPSMWARGAVNFTHLVTALPALGLLVGVGGQWLVESFLTSARPLRDARVVALLVLIVGVSMALTANAIFARWPEQEGIVPAYRAYLGRLAGYLDRTNDGLTTVICTFDLKPRDAQPTDPALLRMMMHRDTDHVRFSDCLTGMVLTGGGTAQRVAFANPEAASAVSPVFKAWLRGATNVAVGGLPPASVLQINVERELADALGTLTLGHVWWTGEENNIVPTAKLPVRMGYNLTFEGYLIVPNTRFKLGQIVTLITYWRVDGPQQPDLQLFGHLTRDSGADPLQQNDILSVEATTLQDRDILIQIIPFAPLPPDFPPGDYLVSVGAYRRDTNERFPVYDQDVPRGDRLFLDRITVTP
jgi:4-amino-4-deoxy-L-arabinose transferase-like glycosyltransferase